MARRSPGFRAAGALLAPHLRQAGEKRGFAVARLLTHWAEVVGAELAPLAEPVKLSWGREGFGATLTLRVAGPAGPLVEASRETIRARVNACYGYNAVARILLTQTGSARGFAEPAARFAPAAAAAADPATVPTGRVAQRAADLARGVGDDALRTALARLGAHVLSRPQS